jgi:hypothetical protein
MAAAARRRPLSTGSGATAGQCYTGQAIRRSAAWLAILAVLAQAIFFEFAMAARAATAREQAAAAYHVAQHVPQDDQDVPRQHQHSGKDGPFCIARAMHQAPALPTDIVVLLLFAVVSVPPLPRARVRARRRPARFRSRSPPREP